MSNYVHTIAQRRVVGSATRKAVLVYLADRASDDGTGIWMSKATAAAHLELSKRSVQKVIGELEAEGIVSKVGERPCENGYTVEYQINLEALHDLPKIEVKGTGRPRKNPVNQIHPVNHVHGEGCTTFTGRGESGSPKPSLEPSKEPSISPKPPEGAGEDLFSDNDQPAEAAQKPVDRFPEFYEAYPRKIARGQAEKAWAKAVKTALPQAVIDGARRYAALCRQKGTEAQFIAHPATWLNGQRWADEDLRGVRLPEEITPQDRAARFRPPSWQTVIS